ncbi:tRNA dihydrouridine synthase Dus2 [Schizosaccharomyces japonicus yFS275]|uniref:tRNA dihydrouridine synthase Dus2 n=1 Tax=Schizosaccharomyces japonicus (strain yFS275 / FY16936) TaxID=402676 RepID=B6K3P6_SCHJY|nr:tRNA dihydrouridine synthase Dus2 [Schizosaccharomyces japonicus yFS275]EEB08103.1 tRNA dihydrouridine synthase Dus2 [Schizosaccharomyces japonicus yFS275]
MVRIGELPTRLLALRYGADLVWGPEIVDKALVSGEKAQRVVNDHCQTIDFVKPPSNKVIFRLHPLEKGRLIFQLGSCNPELAVEAAKLVVNDVSAIDLNCGCPKHFSVHAGMGAGLLKNLDRLESILRALVEQVGQPNNIGISCKIRLLDTHEATLDMVRRLCKTGIRAITVHCRTTPMRNTEPAIRTSLRDIAEICHSYHVSILVNGDVDNRKMAKELCEEYGVDGAVIARAAEKNVSCFREEGLLPIQQVVKDYVKMCLEVDNNFGNTKYCLIQWMQGNFPKDIRQRAQVAKSYGQLLECFDLSWDRSSESQTVQSQKSKNYALFLSLYKNDNFLSTLCDENLLNLLSKNDCTKVIIHLNADTLSDTQEKAVQRLRKRGIRIELVDALHPLDAIISKANVVVCSSACESILAEADRKKKPVVKVFTRTTNSEEEKENSNALIADETPVIDQLRSCFEKNL